jgi:hypothetical protein
VSDATLLQALPVEALQASSTQNRRKAAPVLALLSKSLISSGLHTVLRKTNAMGICQETIKKPGWISTTPSSDTLPVVVAAASDTRYSA